MIGPFFHWHECIVNYNTSHIFTDYHDNISTLMQLDEDRTVFKPGDNIRIKFSGDGAKLSRTSDIIILSFSILVPQGRYLSGTGELLSSKPWVLCMQVFTLIGPILKRQLFACTKEAYYSVLNRQLFVKVKPTFNQVWLVVSLFFHIKFDACLVD